MKSIFIFIALMGCFSLFGGDLQTITLNKNYAATVEFCSDINAVIFGNNPTTGLTPDGLPIFKYYEMFQTGKVVVFRCRTDSPPETTLTIILKNGEVWDGFIKFAESPEKTRYTFCVIKTEDNEADKTEKKIQQSMKRIAAMDAEIQDIAVVKRSETYQVVNLANDSDHTYIKILLQNRSASDFIIDAVMFKYQEGKKHFFNKKEVVNKNWMPVSGQLFPEESRVSAKTVGTIVLAIPLYTTEQGHLNIKIIEKNGSRSSDFFIEAKDMATIKVFK